MNDNDLPKYDWNELIQEEWGYWPLSCTYDELNPKMVHAVFDRSLDVTGEMCIKGYTIVPHILVLSEPAYPFTHRRSSPKVSVRSHRVEGNLAIS